MNKVLKSIMTVVAIVASLSIASGKVYADGQYGKDIIKNKSFRIEKEVRIKDEGSYEDKLILTKSDWDEVIEFRIRIKNVGEVTTDKMKMEDFLPSELKLVKEDGLTEHWDGFEPGETKTYKIEARIKDSELDRENFDKCVVNKAEVRYDGKFEGADTATVCYGDRTVTELPETGFEEVLIPLGLGLIVASYVIKKSREAR